MVQYASMFVVVLEGGFSVLFLNLSYLYRQSALLFLSIIFIITIDLFNILPIPAIYRIILVSFPFITIILWFELWLSTWGKTWTLSATLFIIVSQVYPSNTLGTFILYNFIYLLGMIFLYSKKKTHDRLLHQSHVKTIHALVRQNPPLIQTIDYTREAIIILDNMGKIIESNPQSSLLLSRPESSLIGQPIFKVLGILSNFQDSNTPKQGEFTWETYKEGIKNIRFQTRPLLESDAGPCTLLMLFDISEEKKNSEAYLQAAKLSIIDQVSAGLAHEIRNPLTTIKGFMQLITPEQWPENFRPYQQLILDEIQSIDRMLNKFVLITSPSAPQKKLFNLTETIQAMVQTIQPTRLTQGVTLLLELPPHSLYVMGDHEQLLQALLSLLNNAIDASPKEGKVIIRLTEHESHVRISVIDNGPGIPENLRQRVLDPFFTTHEEGTGLGLTIAQKIILAHQGKLHFSKSPLPRGTEVMIDLPYALNSKSKRLA